MADNITLNSGSGGATLSTDEVASAHIQRVKLTDGTDGSAAAIPGDATNGLDVDVTRVQGTVTISGTVTANAGTNLNTSTLALESGGNLAAIRGAVSGTEMQVDVVAALPAGTNNIGDVDVLSVVPGTAATNLGKAVGAAAGATDTGVSILGIRDDALSTLSDPEADYVPVRLNANGALWTVHDGNITVTPNGGSMPVNDNGAALSIDLNGVTPSVGSGVTGTGTLRVNLASDVALPPGTNNIGDVDVLTVNGVAPAFGSGVRGSTVQRVTVATDDVVPASQSGTWTVGMAPATSGGLLVSRAVSAASTNATSAKGSAGQVFGWAVFNTNASARYLKIYNKATAPTVGTDTPVLTITIPGNTAGAGANVEFANGIAFGTGIGWALTTGVADSDTGAVAANEIVVNLMYK